MFSAGIRIYGTISVTIFFQRGDGGSLVILRGTSRDMTGDRIECTMGVIAPVILRGTSRHMTGGALLRGDGGSRVILRALALPSLSVSFPGILSGNGMGPGPAQA